MTKQQPSQFPATRAEHLKDSVRCMSDVMTDIANLLGIPENEHGDPDHIFEAIETLQAKLAAYQEAVIVLPEGAEPEVEDVVVAGIKTEFPKVITECLGDGVFRLNNESEYINQFSVRAIIQRAGKPTIYANALLKAGLV